LITHNQNLPIIIFTNKKPHECGAFVNLSKNSIMMGGWLFQQFYTVGQQLGRCCPVNPS